MSGTDGLLFMENEQYSLVDALPYIDTQLGQTEVAQQVKALIDEEMTHFEPRDYLASLPPPGAPVLSSETKAQEYARIEAGLALQGIDASKYKVEAPEGAEAQEHEAWKKQADNMHVQIEYNRLRQTNLELLERWGNKAWIAHSSIVRAAEKILGNETNNLRALREEVNKKRKLDQISCGNELRRLNNELEQYTQDNAETGKGLRALEAEVDRLRRSCRERGILVAEDDAEANPHENGVNGGANHASASA